MIYWLLSFLTGAVIVAQGGLNRKITTTWGLSGAILLTSILVLIFSIVFYWICIVNPKLLPESFNPKVDFSSFQWWYIIPSVCGFIIICAIPALIPTIGASNVFLCIVIGQLFFSVLWDLQFESTAPTPQKLIGIGVAILGILISYWKK